MEFCVGASIGALAYLQASRAQHKAKRALELLGANIAQLH